MDKEKRIIIAGGRNFNNYDLLKEKLLKYIGFNTDVTVISGGAMGADTLGEKFAKEYKLYCMTIPALWNVYGKSAGYKRNVQMAKYASQEEGILFAFWNGVSKGTSHMIDIAKQYGLEIQI